MVNGLIACNIVYCFNLQISLTIQVKPEKWLFQRLRIYIILEMIFFFFFLASTVGVGSMSPNWHNKYLKSLRSQVHVRVEFAVDGEDRGD
jgi:hypothetical protein